MCVNMYAGEMDPVWVALMQPQVEIFRNQGFDVRFTIEKGEGHVMRTLENAGAARLFDNFEACGK